MSPATLAHCSILLLAGGQGSRMGGQDKGLVTWRGKPMVAWIHQVARPLTDELLISCNRNQDRYTRFADRVVSDAEPGFLGPLAGIRAGLAASTGRWTLVLPCDAPRVDEALLVQMYEAARADPDRPVMIRQGDRWQPLFCVIPTQLACQLEAAWQAGERSNYRVLERLGARALNLEPYDQRLANLNTPEIMAQHASGPGT
ncbi:molybdenum cofactor guanylyltransferase MobA [Pseudomonas sp. PS1]|uniref:Molybdenum cofactor guanylyltransferase n=1 Tax=Stutzerimonas marianensis TaxID=2929513 RepID=A0A9X2AWW1_9GAMM|nr:molybdenum cofactor guanylyltransferase MobA [Pseudomonas marianensis]MCJ0975877.1 molybdenum cofactor guanylyltransferase MobA [Pseudomonas marianensis]